MALLELLRKAQMEDTDFLREEGRVLSQVLRELEVSQQSKAWRYERSLERTDGYRDRAWDTRVRTIQLKVPKGREGSYYPSLLDPRKRAERALVAVVQALGMNGISKSQVPRLCQELDAELERSRSRKLAGDYPYVWLDVAFVKVRDDERVVSMAVVIAIGVKATGEWGCRGWTWATAKMGPSGRSFCEGWWPEGLRGVKLVTRAAHERLKGAVAAVLQGATWQGDRVHCVRNALALVPKAAVQLVAADHPDGARAARSGKRLRAVGAGGRELQAPVPQPRSVDGRG